MKKEITFSTKNRYEFVDITEQVKRAVKESGIKQGICQIYTPHATCAIIINENYDPNVCTDTINALNNLIPEGKWLHDRVDNNAAAHIKSAILGPSETIPINDGKLILGTWQSPMLCDFDGPRQRKVIINIIKS